MTLKFICFFYFFYNQSSACHSLILNPLKTKALLFGKERNVEMQIKNIAIILKGNVITIVCDAQDLWLTVDNSLHNFRYRKYTSSILGRAYDNLKLLYLFRSIFSAKLEDVLCQIFVLPLFKYLCVVCIWYLCRCCDRMQRVNVCS